MEVSNPEQYDMNQNFSFEGCKSIIFKIHNI